MSDKKVPAQVGGDKHYDNMKKEPIEIIEEMGESFLEGFCKGNVLKYRMRAEFKNGQEDLDKAQWYEDYWLNYLERTKTL